VTIWDTSTNQPVCTIPNDQALSLPASTYSLVFSPDGRQLVIHRFRPIAEPEFGQRAEGYWEFWLHSVDDGRLLARFESKSLDRHFLISSVCFRPDGGQMALAHELYFDPNRPTQLQVWDLKQYVELPPVELPWKDARLLGYTADGAQLIVASTVGDSVRVSTFDGATRHLQSSREFPGDLCRYNARQNRVGVRDKTDMVFYDLATGNEVARLQGFDPTRSAWSPDGRRFAAQARGDIRSQIVVWSLETGRRLVTLDGPDNLGAIAFSGDGHRLLARSSYWPSDHPSQVWDATPLPDAE
jgi:WD40 repeat protein